MSILSSSFNTTELFTLLDSDDTNEAQRFVDAVSEELNVTFKADYSLSFINSDDIDSILIEELEEAHPEIDSLPWFVQSAIDYDMVRAAMRNEYGTVSFGDELFYYKEG